MFFNVVEMMVFQEDRSMGLYLSFHHFEQKLAHWDSQNIVLENLLNLYVNLIYKNLADNCAS